jgi:hypothetical protein
MMSKMAIAIVCCGMLGVTGKGKYRNDPYCVRSIYTDISVY